MTMESKTEVTGSSPVLASKERVTRPVGEVGISLDVQKH